MTRPLEATKSREFHCDECNARCTRGTDGETEYGHRHFCSRRETAGVSVPPRYSGKVSTYTDADDEFECPACDETSPWFQSLQQHHVREHGFRMSQADCQRCGVTVLLSSKGHNSPRCLPCYAATDDHPHRIDADPRELAADGGESDAE